MSQSFDEDSIYTLHRPHPSLKKYYILASFLWGPFFFIPLIINMTRYATMQYNFDEKGISMRWGRLVRREISLRYVRIQDIHLSSNMIERRFNLAKIELQTASAQSKAEMTIEGFLEFEAMRNFLYSKMHGADMGEATNQRENAGLENLPMTLTQTDIQTLNASLQAVTEVLRDIRLALEQKQEADAPPYIEEKL